MTNGPMSTDAVLTALDGLVDHTPRENEPAHASLGDRRDGAVYLMDNELVLAVKVALSTGRPLLLTGDPGTGKSTLAAFLAAHLGWKYYEHVITGRSEATDLLWTFDTIRKLSDATAAGAELDDRNYVEPGVLWKAFDPVGASARRATPKGAHLSESNEKRSPYHAVVLIDEIDKADPDLPNALLVPLGSNEFEVTEIRQTVTAVNRGNMAAGGGIAPPALIMITSNGERDLPPAFVRRCVAYRLTVPGAERLLEIATAHAIAEGRPLSSQDRQLARDLAKAVQGIRDERDELGRQGPGTAEFLDALRASRELRIDPSDQLRWNGLLSLTLRKNHDES